ncbi:MAG: GNAT family N-acetyltransferase [Caldimonas sp.]
MHRATDIDGPTVEAASAAAFFDVAGYRVVEIGDDEIALLQRFFERNPDYFLAVNGEVAGAGQAHEEVHGELPAGWPFTKKWVLGIAAQDGALVAMLNVVSDLLAEGVWHIGLFIVAREHWGTGLARSLLRQLEGWAVAGGAGWLRLGVVEGNRRAERFWEGAGFIGIRRRAGLTMGKKVNTVRVMARPLAGGTVADYLALVTRDDPRSP